MSIESRIIRLGSGARYFTALTFPGVKEDQARRDAAAAWVGSYLHEANRITDAMDGAVWRRLLPPDDTPKANMGSRCINHFRMACRWSKTLAVIGGAQMRSTFYDFSPYPYIRLGWVRTITHIAATRIFLPTAGILGLRGEVSLRPPALGPFPHISNEVV